MINPSRPLMSILFLGILAAGCYADLVAPPAPYVVSSQDGKYYFKMIPNKKDTWNYAKAKGTLYEVRAGKDKLVYSVFGWYAYQVFISNNGKYLIRMGDWASGEPKAGDLAVAFYEDGKIKKSYSTVDLRKNPAQVPRSISHYKWLEDVSTSYLSTDMFSVVTVEKVEITFNIISGEIMFTEPVKDSESK